MHEEVTAKSFEKTYEPGTEVASQENVNVKCDMFPNKVKGDKNLKRHTKHKTPRSQGIWSVWNKIQYDRRSKNT